MISVVIARTSNDIIWEGLEHLLSTVSDIDVNSVDNEAALIDMLNSGYLDVLILDKSFGTQQDSNYKHYFEYIPGLGIIVIAPTSCEMIIHLQNAGCELLVRQIRTLASEEPRSENDTLTRLQYINPADVENLVVKPLGIKVISTTGYANSREHLDDICEWIDLSLHLHFVSETASGGEVNTPGWAMSAGQARALLNEAYTNAEEAELRQSRQQLEKKMAAKEDANRRGYGIPKLVTLADAFGLTEIERQILLFALAPEIDGRYARIFGYLNDDLTRRRPTPTILNQLVYRGKQLAWDIRQLITSEGPLEKYQLLLAEPNDPLPASEVGLKPSPEIVSFLLAEHGIPPNYNPALELHQANSSSKAVAKEELCDLQERLNRWRRMIDDKIDLPIIQLLGDVTTLEWFKQTAANAGDEVVILNVAAIDESSDSRLSDLIRGAIRVAVMHHAILIVSGLTFLALRERQRFEKEFISLIITRVSRLVIHCKEPWIMPGIHEVWQIKRKLPDFNARTDLWREHARLAGIKLPQSDASVLAATVRFDAPEIDATLALCRGESFQDNELSSLQAAARQVARTMVPSLVRRIDTVFGWGDIVLPKSTMTLLQQISGHVRHAGEVFEDWGYRSRFPFGCGVAALFSGPSGTGKTMAAQIIANELGVELFQIDLANTVSKYIGETEKNLDVIFNAAERASAVLLFDEADALFGKRTDVKDAHDRYANVEVAYLLQRMEAYSGLAILTSNFKQNLDSAFLRRLRFVIEFPAPSATHREAIWRCVFPQKVPFADDVDVKFLARRLELTGGHIQQIAVRAAFSAVVEGGPVYMKHIVQATSEELIKLGMLSAERSLSVCVPILVKGNSS